MKIFGDPSLIKAAEDAAGAFVAVITADRRIVSTAGSALPAETTGDLVGKCCFAVFYGRQSPCDNCGLDAVMDSGQPVLALRPSDAENGGAQEANHIFPLPPETGAAAWCCRSVAGEISAPRKPDLSVAFLSKLIHSAVDGVIAADMHGRIRIFNDAAAALFGYSVKEALGGLDIRSLYPDNIAKQIMGHLRSERFGGKGRLTAHRVLVLSKTGEAIPVQVNASIITEGGREIATIGFFRDLREEIRLKNALAGLNQPTRGGQNDVPLAEILEGFTLQMAAYDSRFGALAVANGLVTGEQVDLALLKQQEIIEKAKIHIPIGRVLIQLGFLNEGQREALLSLQRPAEGAVTAPDADTLPVADRIEAAPGLPAEADSAPPPSPEKEDEPAFTIRVAGDGLSAVLAAAPAARRTLTPAVVLDRLTADGIHALEGAPGDIAAFLSSADPAEGATLVVARGIPSTAGTPAEIAYHFDTDPLRAGTERIDGTIDWKDRGGIPQVAAGDVLATIVPGTPGVSGTDVYGNPIPAPATDDPFPGTGKGVLRSDDGRTYTAARSGMAVLTAEGVLEVLETLTIDGDIGLDTGHVDFDGHIEAAGAVQEGYRVSGGSLRVTDINRAEVTLTGDLVVTGGIYESVVRCGGSIKASHIHKSTLASGKDLSAGREIIDSRVETSGKCLVSGGTIISSEISARMGIVSGHVGTDAAKPTTLQVGVNLRLQRQIHNARNKIGLLKKEKNRLSGEWASLSTQSERVSEELGEKAQQQDKCMVQIRELTAERETLQGDGDKARRKLLEKQIQMLEKKKENLDTQVEALLERDDTLSQGVSRMAADIAGQEKDLAAQTAALEALIAAAAVDKGIATVKVSGKMAAGTTIAGPNAVLLTREELGRVLAMETDKPDADGLRRWRITTQPLR